MKTSRISIIAAATVAIALALVACPSTSKFRGDASADLACTHYYNVLNDADAGVLSGDRLQVKLGEVLSSARASRSPGIARAAEDSVRSILLQGGAPTYSLVQACTALGYQNVPL